MRLLFAGRYSGQTGATCIEYVRRTNIIASSCGRQRSKALQAVGRRRRLRCQLFNENISRNLITFFGFLHCSIIDCLKYNYRLPT